MGHFVYKYVFNGEIIYVGKSDSSLSNRILSHGKKGDNIEEDGWDEIRNSEVFYAELPNRTMSDVVETELIAKYKPKYNKAKKSEWAGLGFEEPEWTNFKDYKPKKDKKEQTDRYKEKYRKMFEEYKRLQDEYIKLFEEKQELESRRKCDECEKWEHIKRCERIICDYISCYACKTPEESKTEEEIFEEYHDGKPINYISETFYKDGSLASRKQLHKTAGGALYFQFVQGDECPRGGYIFYRPGEKEMHNKELIRLWRNRGGIKYLWKDLEENKLDTLKHEKTLLGA